MRGFRASRAMQNFKSSRFGKQSHLRVHNGGWPNQDQQQQEQKPLPDWLKMPASPMAEGPKKTAASLKLVDAAPSQAKRTKAKAGLKKAPAPAKKSASARVISAKPKKKSASKSAASKKRKLAA